MSARKGIRSGTIAVALALFAASEDGDICIGGGHPGYALALMVVTGAATVTALGGWFRV